MTRKKQHRLRPYLPHYIMLSPFYLIFFVFLFIPMVAALVLSFTSFNMLQTPMFVGLDNYVRLFLKDEIFLNDLKNTLFLAVITGPVGYILSCLVAWLINEMGRGLRTLLTAVMYAQTLCSSVYYIWIYLFSNDRSGFINAQLIKMGLVQSPIQWLSDPQYSMTVVVVVTIWMSFGVGFLSFVAGLKSLDRTYYEAAALDGLRNRWQELYYVTFPQMGPQLLFGAVMSISGAFSVGEVNKALTGFPSTDYATDTIALHMADYGTIRFEMGYASAVAVVLFGMTVLAWVIVNRALRRFNETT